LVIEGVFFHLFVGLASGVLLHLLTPPGIRLHLLETLSIAIG
jgi:hypothetical protein